MNGGAAWDEAGTSANPVAVGADGAGAVHGTSAVDTGGVGGPPNLPIPPITELAAAGLTMALGAGGLGIITVAAGFAGGWKVAGRKGGTAGLGGGGTDAFPTNVGFGQAGGRPAIESTGPPLKLCSTA